MITAVNAIYSYSDHEYQVILQELMRLGIAPSGNKAIDKAKLEKAKAELVEKIIQKEKNNNSSDSFAKTIAPVEEVQDGKKAEMEEHRLGAMTVAELNRLYFGI